MTLHFAAPRASIAHRIAAAHRSDTPAIIRRALASALHAEMAKLPDDIGLAADWRALGRLLRDCEVELYADRTVDSFERAREFSVLADDAHNRGVLMRVRVERDAIRKGRRVPRIIDAACTEVHS